MTSVNIYSRNLFRSILKITKPSGKVNLNPVKLFILHQEELESLRKKWTIYLNFYPYQIHLILY